MGARGEEARACSTCPLCLTWPLTLSSKETSARSKLPSHGAKGESSAAPGEGEVADEGLELG